MASNQQQSKLIDGRTRSALFWATGFGSGYLPIAPGSWGSLVIAGAAWWLLKLPIVWYLALTAIIFTIGILVAGIADQHFRSRGGKDSDNGQIVIDEWAGQLITLLPLFYFEKSLLNIGIGFVLFRIFDVLKFGFAKYFDKRHDHWGVMLDDVFAGVHAGIFFFIALWMMYRM
ncbi:MAG: phosphatidylglycerophosphatase A [Patescibacteria group bacterium]